MSQISLSHNEAAQRYDAHIDGQLAGFAEYTVQEQAVTFTHTKVEPNFEGQGVGGALARFALDDVRERGGVKVVPQCPFIRSWIDKHPDYQDLT